MAGVLQLRNYNFHYFGELLCIYLFIFYFFKAVVIHPNGRDKGQLIAHLLLLKTPALAVYPSYAELADYCSGFMAADLPWLNSYLSDLLSDPRDVSPAPFFLFYTSLSLASTFLLALAVIIALALLLLLGTYLGESSSRRTFKNIGLFLYNFFLAGTSFAAIACVQGAFLNTAS